MTHDNRSLGHRNAATRYFLGRFAPGLNDSLQIGAPVSSWHIGYWNAIDPVSINRWCHDNASRGSMGDCNP